MVRYFVADKPHKKVDNKTSWCYIIYVEGDTNAL